MENREEGHDGGDTCNNSKSLDPLGLHDEKSGASIKRDRTGHAKLCVSGETLPVEGQDIIPGRPRRSRRSSREISPNGFQSAIKKRRKDSSISGSLTCGLDSNIGEPRNLNGSSSIGCTSRCENGFALPSTKTDKSSPSCSNAKDSSTLGGDINIPRRPRCVLRRKNSPINIKEARGLLTSIGKSNSSAHSNNLSSNLVIPSHKQKKRYYGSKENGLNGLDSVQQCKRENAGIVQVVQKRSQRNHKNRQVTTAKKTKHLVSEPLSFVDVDNFSDNCHEDDEESLEQNAARMLSSRFDPQCTQLSDGKSGFSPKSSNESSSPLIKEDFKSLDSASSSLDIAGRVLRPRRQYGKGFVHQRKHFYEVCSRGVDPYWVLKRRIRVFWAPDQSWYFGLVKDYNPITKLHHIHYDNRNEEWIDLQNERFKLLLLPSEFSHKFNLQKPKLKAKQEHEAGIVTAAVDNCVGNFLESEPIISWLARSAHRVKTSSLRILKEKGKSHFKNNLHSSLLEAKAHVIGNRSHMNSRKTFVMPERSTDGKATEVTHSKTKNCSDDGKFTFVYSRRRSRNKVGTVGNKLEEDSFGKFSDSAKLVVSVAGVFVANEESGVTLNSLRVGEGTLIFQLPLQCISSIAWLPENSWLCKILYMHHHGKLMLVWPTVCMEIVFLDNNLGLRLLSFKGYLQHAIAVLCLFIRIFHQSNGHKFTELQLPFTSIGFRLSCLPGEGRQLCFYVYNFFDLESSQWHYLSRKLKQLAVTMKEHPLSECTYANVKNLFSASEKRPFRSDCWEPSTLESLQKMSWKGFIHQLNPKISANSHTGFPYFRLNGQSKSCPFSLFATAPASFLFLHFKTLMEKNFACMSYKIPDAVPLLNCPENLEKFTDKHCPPDEDSSDKFSDTTRENFGSSMNQAVAGSRWFSCLRPKFDSDALSLSNDDDWVRTHDTSPCNELNSNRKSAAHGMLGKSDCDETDSRFQRYPFSRSWQDFRNQYSPLLEDISSPEESEGDCGSFLNTVFQTQASQLDDDVSHRMVQHAEKSATYLTCSINGQTIHNNPNPTAPRTMWHRNRQNIVSASVSHHSKLWPEDWDGLIGYKKPRTQASYTSSFGNHDIGTKARSHYQKGRPYKKLKVDNPKKTLAGSKSLEDGLDSLICDANILVTVGDRGWREYGARVVIGSDDQKEWQILVKLAGATKYWCKVHQLLQPGTTNRFTHAMMWKGGKDWTLEFTDRRQWSLFKELYDECYNRNVRAASVKNIPIPGVCLIEDCDDCATEMPFVRSSPRYFRQIGTEVDVALDPCHVLYDMDSEDEEWISRLRNSADDSGTTLQGISEELFEKAMDKFEKISFAEDCDEFTDAEIDNFMTEVGLVEVIKAIHEHWRQKRQKKGMPLIRQFQPPLWERYQQQVKQWESTVSKMHHTLNGCQVRAFCVEKPPMFAFCLRPRGLEVPNKGSKQRSHKKFPVNGNQSSFARENYSLQGKRLNGYSPAKEKALVTVPDGDFSDVTTWLQSPTGISPRSPGPGFMTSANGSSDRNHHFRLDRNNSKKLGVSVSPRGHLMTPTAYAQRTKGTGIYRSNASYPERFNATQHKSDGFQRRQAGIDEFMLRDASSAAQHASNMAKLKRERAQWLMHKADLAVHKAVVALLTADAIKASEKDMTGDG